jgi:1,2-diacylglycerol 3-beta-galactosyltransferase
MHALPEVLLLVVDAGGGHRAAANALLAAAEVERPPFRLRVESLQAVLEPLDIVRRLSGLNVEQLYNAMVRRRMTGHLVPLLRVLQFTIRRLHRPLARQVARHRAAGPPPAAVVSLAPNFNAVIRDGVRAALPGVPFLVLLTDLADFPPHFWMEPGVDGALVGSARAVRQALDIGLPAHAVSRVSGMVLHPRFYRVDHARERAALRAEMGVPEGELTVLLLFGGKGTPEMAPLARRLLCAHPRWHVVAVCGDNPRLYRRMAAVEAASEGRLHRLGFTDRVPELLCVADVLLTKPGPGSLSEAFHSRVPVVVTLDARTIPQERFNAAFVAEAGLGVVVRGWKDMPAAARALAHDPERLRRLRESLASLPDNRAVWEALEVIEARIAVGDAAAERHGRVIRAS